MHYEIEVNVARKGAPPYWRTLQDENDCDCVWDTEAEAREALDEEGRGENARIMRYVGGIGKPIE